MAVNQVIVSWVARQMGQRIGDGQCWTLAETALDYANAKTSNDIMGAKGVNSKADYIWGREVGLAQLQPGDIIQFHMYKFTRHTEDYDESGGRGDSAEPRHTAIVSSVGEKGQVAVYEQNIDGGPVEENTLYFDKHAPGVTITGKWKFYRPIPKP